METPVMHHSRQDEQAQNMSKALKGTDRNTTGEKDRLLVEHRALCQE